jgi:hypothetical protein
VFTAVAGQQPYPLYLGVTVSVLYSAHPDILGGCSDNIQSPSGREEVEITGIWGVVLCLQTAQDQVTHSQLLLKSSARSVRGEGVPVLN